MSDQMIDPCSILAQKIKDEFPELTPELTWSWNELFGEWRWLPGDEGDSPNYELDVSIRERAAEVAAGLDEAMVYYYIQATSVNPFNYPHHSMDISGDDFRSIVDVNRCLLDNVIYCSVMELVPKPQVPVNNN